jgi:hypothetical protein
MRAFSVALAFILASAVAGCNTVRHDTPSGKVEETIQAPIAQIKPDIAAMMFSRGYQLQRETDYSMAFDAPMTSTGAQVFFGSRFNSVPDARLTFSMAPEGGSTRVIVDCKIVTNPGTAFETYTDINGSKDTMALQHFLDDEAAKFRAQS